MQILSERRFAVAAFVTLVLFWGSAFTVIKVGLDYSPPMLFAGMRALFGGSAVGLAALVWSGKPHLRREWVVYLLLMLLNVVFFLGLQTLAIMNLPSGTAAVLIYLQPILTGLLAYLILGESLQVTKLVGLLLGFAGIVAVSAEGLSGTVSPMGIAFAVVAALSWALGTVYFKKAQEKVPLLWAIAIPFTFGGIVLTTFGLLTEPVSGITWNPALVASLLYAALIGTGLAYV
ncbi:MAG: DMT family transporter, partial [Rubrobacteraceae bacterium]